VVRLHVLEHYLLGRQLIRRREVGPGYDYQVPRTIEYTHPMEREPAEDRLVVDT